MAQLNFGNLGDQTYVFLFDKTSHKSSLFLVIRFMKIKPYKNCSRKKYKIHGVIHKRRPYFRNVEFWHHLFKQMSGKGEG